MGSIRTNIIFLKNMNVPFHLTSSVSILYNVLLFGLRRLITAAAINVSIALYLQKTAEYYNDIEKVHFSAEGR